MDNHLCENDDEAIIDRWHLAQSCMMKLEWKKLKILKLKVAEKFQMMQKPMMNLTLETCGSKFMKCGVINKNKNIKNTRPADILVSNWDGSASAAFDISVTSPLNSSLVVEAGMSSGVAAKAAEKRKHLQNDAKCKQLGWRCIPLVVETYGAWGAEAIEVFSTVASRLAIWTNSTKSRALATLYGRLSMILVRANAGAILM